jgi:hypothetical protein
MRKRTVAVAVVLLLAASACGEPNEQIRNVRRALDRTRSQPHQYVYTERADGRTIEVRVKVDDSFRSATTLSLDGEPLLQQVVVDDAVALKLPSPGEWNPAAGTPLEELLGSGKWVIDPAGAPPVLFTSEDEGDILDVGRNEIADALNAFDYAEAAAGGARQVIRFSKESLDYFPSEDPFRDLVDDDDKAGITRYDAVPPALPRTNEGQRGPESLPGARVFRKLSIYVKDERVVRILEAIDFESHRELVKAKEEGGPEFLLDMLSGLRRGLGQEPLRTRTMSVEVTEREADIELPSGVQANIGELLASNALSRLPGDAPEEEEQDDRPRNPSGLPTPAPAESPASSPA